MSFMDLDFFNRRPGHVFVLVPSVRGNYNNHVADFIHNLESQANITMTHAA